MSPRLQVSIGQYSDKGRKPENQDFYGACIPDDSQLDAKGVAVAVADGISTSAVSHIASESAVKGFLADYYCTSDAWSVKTSAQRVLAATNSWLHAQTRQSRHRYDMDRGYVCTFSAMVLRAATAHIFHAGDSRIYRLRGSDLECLTEDHRLWVSQDQSYLSRAMGAGPHLELDYQALPMEQGDIYLLLTDGVYAHLGERHMTDLVQQHAADPDAAARALVEQALEQGSQDNLTAQVLRIDALPGQNASEMLQQLAALPFPPVLEPRASLDGYEIVRELHASSRSHVYLALDGAGKTPVAIKALSTELQQDPAHVERFLMEEWIARRIDSAHVLKAYPQGRRRSHLYTVSEYFEGCTLTQWMRDHPRPDLQTVRNIVEQIARGLRAFHRLEMLHQDLRPDNILIDRTGTVKIIDFGSTLVAGMMDEPGGAAGRNHLLGTVQYAAPEYFLGEAGSTRSDLFSLGVIAYQMLTGRLPYGTQVAKARSRAAQARLVYESALDYDREIPAWVDDVLKKAVHPDPAKRYPELSEFVHELRQPGRETLGRKRAPLIERNPAALWKGLCLCQTVALVLLLLR